jgi:hypothetical protein
MADIAYNGGFTETLVKKTFFNHVFSTTEEGKSEIYNILQYAGIAIVPVVILNKLIQRFIPDADPDKSSLEISFEVVLQVAILFIGIILIHRTVTFVPTWSGYKYEQIALTSTVLTFLIIVLSIQTKLGIKVSILAERIGDLWNGTDSRHSDDEGDKKNVRVKQPLSKMITGGGHSASQADFMDNPQLQNDLFPPAPTATTKGSVQKQQQQYSFEPAPANSMIGSSFGSLF